LQKHYESEEMNGDFFQRENRCPEKERISGGNESRAGEAEILILSGTALTRGWFWNPATTGHKIIGAAVLPIY